MQYTSEIQRASLSDLDRLFDIEQQCFHPRQVYSKRHLNHLISKTNSVTLVEKYENVIRGFVIVLLRNKFQMAGIETIDVDPKFRGQGIALNLLHAAENQIKDQGFKLIQLEVSTTNESAIKLYDKAG
ncbi:MAG: GNAT family N-acetyltransferase, partial [Candidatus Thermoplasmatota archaeon]|nr:GNAT family N-acetyltransferase [Candidatus Thermoplasmatota archaeon]